MLLFLQLLLTKWNISVFSLFHLFQFQSTKRLNYNKAGTSEGMDQMEKCSTFLGKPKDEFSKLAKARTFVNSIDPKQLAKARTLVNHNEHLEKCSTLLGKPKFELSKLSPLSSIKRKTVLVGSSTLSHIWKCNTFRTLYL